MTAPQDPNVGRVLKSTYRIERLIGRGGMGAVYAARHTKISKRYAIKLLLPEFGRTDTIRERFFREAEACSRIEHENVVDTLDFDETPNGELYMVMELLVGQDLAARLGTRGARSVDDVIRWFSEICGAVSAAHALGIVHRDLKPGNIFLQQRPERELVKVLDFGLAKFRAEGGLTTTGAMMGTPCYMAPEQIEGQGDAVGPTTDIFALGCILYELLLGQIAFQGKSLAQIAYQIVHGDRPQLTAEPWAPVQPVIDRCLANDPAERFQTVDALRMAFITAMGDTDLDEVGGALPVGAPTSGDTTSSAETLAANSGHDATMAADSGHDVTVAADSGYSATVAADSGYSYSATVAADSGYDATVAASSGADATVAADSGADAHDELPDGAQYTTVGRIKRRKWTLVAALVGGLALITGGLFVLRGLRTEDSGKRVPTAKSKKPPPWAKTLDPALLPDLALAEQSTRWLGLSLPAWRRLAEGLEKANQPDLGPRNLAALQTRMYLARSRVDLLSDHLAKGINHAGQALRMAGDSGSSEARLLAAANLAWLHLHRGDLKGARAVLQKAGGPTQTKLRALYAAVSLARGDIGMAISQARKASGTDPDDTLAWLVLATAGDAAGMHLEAERAAAQALSLAPASPLARIQMALKMGATSGMRKAGLDLCTRRKSDPPLHKTALGACRLRLAVRTALDRSDSFTARQVLARVAKTLGDKPLLAVADLLLAEPGLPGRVTERILRVGRGTKTRRPDALLVAAAAALRLGRLADAKQLLAAYSSGSQRDRWGYRVGALRAEMLLRAKRRASGLKEYTDALSAARQVGVRQKTPPSRPDPVVGACDRAVPRDTDHQILQRRVAQLRRRLGPHGRNGPDTPHSPNAPDALSPSDDGFLQVLRMTLRGERLP